MGTFNHPHICWRDNTPGHKKIQEIPEMLLFFKRNWQREVLCWMSFFPIRKGWWEMWISTEALAARTMKWWSLRSLEQWEGCTTSLLPWTSGEQILASSGISLVEYHRIRTWREEGPKKAGQYPRITSGTMHPDQEEIRQESQEAYMDEQDVPGQIPTPKRNLQNLEAKSSSMWEIHRNCLSVQGSGQES